MRKLPKIQFITDDLEKIQAACEGGIRFVQLRIKNTGKKEVLEKAREARSICSDYQCILIINDFPDVAKEVDADGVHLGREDMDIEQARQILGDKKIIGGTANTGKDLIQLQQKKVDYIGLGPYRYTLTKEKLSPVLGKSGYNDLLESFELDIPVYAIGGINIEDVDDLLNTPVYGIALSAAINKADDTAKAAEKFINKISSITV